MAAKASWHWNYVTVTVCIVELDHTRIQSNDSKWRIRYSGAPCIYRLSQKRDDLSDCSHSRNAEIIFDNFSTLQRQFVLHMSVNTIFIKCETQVASSSNDILLTFPAKLQLIYFRENATENAKYKCRSDKMAPNCTNRPGNLKIRGIERGSRVSGPPCIAAAAWFRVARCCMERHNELTGQLYSYAANGDTSSAHATQRPHRAHGISQFCSIPRR